MKYPTVSFLLPTFNSAKKIEKCVQSIRIQQYPSKKIQIIIIDAGSTDNTVTIALKYNCKVLIKKGVLSEAAKSYGLQIAHGEYIVDFADDNRLPDSKWLSTMLKPFELNTNISASYPLRYTYLKGDNAFNRYIALIGVNDVVPYYLKKADRLSYVSTTYNLSGNCEDKGLYYQLEFNISNLPTVGANGFIIKKSILLQANIKPQQYFHIDVIYDLVKKGFDTFAVVKTDIIHETGTSMTDLLRKRIRYMDILYLNQKQARRYHIVTRKDYKKLVLFIIYSLTIIQPLIISFRGFCKIRDLAWFYHPLFCISTVFAYGFIYLKKNLWTRNFQ